MTEEPKNNKTNAIDYILKVFTIFGKLMNEVGIAGFLVILIAVILVCFSTQTQKNEIVDTWVLFKNCNIPYILIVICLLILLFSQNRHHKHITYLNEQRIKELADKKSNFYMNKISDKLSSSNKPKKP